MTIYTNRFALRSPTTATVEPEQTVTYETRAVNADELRSLGSQVYFDEKKSYSTKQNISQLKEERQEIKQTYNEKEDRLRARLKRRDKYNTPEGQAQLQELRDLKERKLAQVNERIAKEESEYQAAQASYQSKVSTYSAETVSAAKAASKKKFKVPTRKVASASDMRLEAQRQAADKELLSNIERNPGIVKPGQLKSQYYGYKYGGGTYTSFGDGLYRSSKGDVEITSNSAPYTDATTGKTRFTRVQKSTAAPKTYNAIDLNTYENRIGLRSMIGTGQYKTAGSLFGATQVSVAPSPEPNASYSRIKPGRFSNEDLLALRYNKGRAVFREDVAAVDRNEKLFAVNKEWGAGVALFGLETKNNAKSAATGVLYGSLWRGAETTFKRAAESGLKGKGGTLVRIFGKAGGYASKAVAPAAVTYYAYQFDKSYQEVESMPDSIDKTRAKAGLLSKTFLEGAGFTVGYKGVAAAVPKSAYGTRPSTGVDFVAAQRGTMTNRGASVSPMMLSKPKTTFYHDTMKFEGYRGLISKPVRTVTGISSRGGFVQKQFSGKTIIVTRQASGSKFSTTRVYRPGKAIKEYRRGDVAKDFANGPGMKPYYTRFDRKEKGFNEDTILLQRGRRVTLYGGVTPVGRGNYLVAAARQQGEVITVTSNRPTTFYRSISQVEKKTFAPKKRGTVNIRAEDYAPSKKFKLSNKEMALFYPENKKALGLYDTRVNVIAVRKRIPNYQKDSQRSVIYHEKGHALADTIGILGKEKQYFRKTIKTTALAKKASIEAKRLQKGRGTLGDDRWIEQYPEKDRPGEMFAELYKIKKTMPGMLESEAPTLNRAMQPALDKKITFSFYMNNQRVRAVGASRESLFGIKDTKLRTASDAKVAEQSFLTSKRSSVDTPYPFNERNAAFPVKTLVQDKGLPTSRIAYRVVTTGRIETVNLGKPVKVVSADTTDRRVRRAAGKELPRQTATSAEVRSGTSSLSKRRVQSEVLVQRMKSTALQRSSGVTVPVGALRSRTANKIVPISATRPSSAFRTTPRASQTPVVRPSSVQAPKPISIAKPISVPVSKLTPTSVSVTRVSQVQVQRTTMTRLGFRPTSTLITRSPPVRRPDIPSFGLPRGSGGKQSRSFFGRQKREYTPSLYAIGVGIRGKRPGKRALKSGFGIRPIEG